MRAPAKCGTSAGYNRHRTLGEPACDACREAKRVAGVERRAKMTPEERLEMSRRQNAKRTARRAAARGADLEAAPVDATVLPKPTEPATYTVSIRCPYCKSPVKAENQRVTRSEIVALLKCTWRGCGHELAMRVQLGAVNVDHLHDPTKCGSQAGYQRHIRRGEQACEDCLRAHSQAQQEREINR